MPTSCTTPRVVASAQVRVIEESVVEQLSERYAAFIEEFEVRKALR
jgi:hypothetical protein